MSQRLNYYAVDGAGFDKLLSVNTHVMASGLDPKLIHLLYLRISQINGCSYCVDLHFKDAIKTGVEARVINGVSNWRYMPFFNAKEKAMFQWVESVTRLPNQDVPEAELAALREHFSDAEIVTLTYAAAYMNAVNRVAIAFGKHPEK